MPHHDHTATCDIPRRGHHRKHFGSLENVCSFTNDVHVGGAHMLTHADTRLDVRVAPPIAMRTRALSLCSLLTMHL